MAVQSVSLFFPVSVLTVKSWIYFYMLVMMSSCYNTSAAQTQDACTLHPFKQVFAEVGQTIVLQTERSGLDYDTQFLWSFGPERYNVLASFNGELQNQSNVRFKGRIRLDPLSGSLTITDLSLNDTGLYCGQVIDDKAITRHSFNVMILVTTSVGEDAVLPCDVGDTTDPADLTVEWNRVPPGDQYVHFWRGGEEVPENQDPSYRGRTSLFQDEVKKGNVSLKLTRVKPSDEGIYTCTVLEFHKKSTVQLNVGYALVCYACMPEMPEKGKTGEPLELDCKSQSIISCDENQMCAAQTVKLEAKKVYFFSYCNNADEPCGSVNMGVIFYREECCSTERCNHHFPQPPNMLPPNGLECFTCKDNDCTNVLQCTGDEDHCINGTVTIGGVVLTGKGCASENMCVGLHTCCKENRCNGESKEYDVPETQRSTGPVVATILLVVAVVGLGYLFWKKKRPSTQIFYGDLITNDAEIRIVLVGKTGAGKSASGNTILGSKAFESTFSPVSETLTCSKASDVVAGRKVSVIDTPGFFNTGFTMERTLEEVRNCIFFAAPGPHVFLAVISIGRYTPEERNVLANIQKVFGQCSDKYTMILFTHGDQLEGAIEEYLNDELKQLISEYSGLYHVFNNTSKDPSQVTELLEKINQMVEENGGSHYTNQMFQEEVRRQVLRMT